jgi:hypothetical protein
MKLTYLLQFAALLHVGLLCAGASMPRVVKLREHLAALPPFPRRLFWVYYAFIGSLIVGFGALTYAFAGPLAAGTPLARAVCLLLALFWIARLCVAAFVFDLRPYLTNGLYRVGHHALNLVFVYLATVYSLAAWKGGTL